MVCNETCKKEIYSPRLIKSFRKRGYKTGSMWSISWITKVLPKRTASSTALLKLASWRMHYMSETFLRRVETKWRTRLTCWLTNSRREPLRCSLSHIVARDEGSMRKGQTGLWRIIRAFSIDSSSDGRPSAFHCSCSLSVVKKRRRSKSINNYFITTKELLNIYIHNT